MGQGAVDQRVVIAMMDGFGMEYFESGELSVIRGLLARVCEEAGTPVRFALSPERDYYVKHHRNFTGCAWIWLHRPADYEPVRATIAALEGVDEIIPGPQAAARYHTLAERLGDMVVNGDRVTMFGDLDSPFEALPPEYRAHGSMHEMRLPLIIYNSRATLDADRFRADKDPAAFLWPA